MWLDLMDMTEHQYRKAQEVSRGHLMGVHLVRPAGYQASTGTLSIMSQNSASTKDNMLYDRMRTLDVTADMHWKQIEKYLVCWCVFYM